MMKNILLFAIILITAISCEKDRRYRGETSALKNGEVWEASNTIVPNEYFNQYFNLRSSTVDEFGDGDRLKIHKIPYGIGKHYLQKTPVLTNDSLIGASYLTFIALDQTTGAWGLPEEPDSSSYINITFYDECTGKMEGTFNMTLIGRYLFQPLDTVYFTDGYFEGRLNED